MHRQTLSSLQDTVPTVELPVASLENGCCPDCLTAMTTEKEARAEIASAYREEMVIPTEARHSLSADLFTLQLALRKPLRSGDDNTEFDAKSSWLLLPREFVDSWIAWERDPLSASRPELNMSSLLCRDGLLAIDVEYAPDLNAVKIVNDEWRKQIVPWCVRCRGG